MTKGLTLKHCTFNVSSKVVAEKNHSLTLVPAAETAACEKIWRKKYFPE